MWIVLNLFSMFVDVSSPDKDNSSDDLAILVPVPDKTQPLPLHTRGSKFGDVDTK